MPDLKQQATKLKSDSNQSRRRVTKTPNPDMSQDVSPIRVVKNKYHYKPSDRRGKHLVTMFK